VPYCGEKFFHFLPLLKLKIYERIVCVVCKEQDTQAQECY
jgi:hypothetical protein